MSDAIEMKISKLLIQEYPKLLNADSDAATKAAVVLATVLGSMMSQATSPDGSDFEEVLSLIVAHIRTGAEKTRDRTLSGDANTTLQ